MKLLLVAICAFFATSLGAPTSGTSFPFLVSIQNGLFGNAHECGGTILSPSWVATAAHCVGITLLTSRVVAGVSDLSNVDNNTNAQIRFIDLYHVIKHPDYDGITNDIALLKMKEPFEFNGFVKALPISIMPCVAVDEPNIFASWGSTEGRSILTPNDLTIVPFAECYDSIFEEYGDNLPIKEELHICVSGQRSPCIQDGGSPLIQDSRMIGLLSWLPETCLTGSTPAIFTNIGYHKSFIRQHVDDL